MSPITRHVNTIAVAKLSRDSRVPQCTSRRQNQAFEDGAFHRGWSIQSGTLTILSWGCCPKLLHESTAPSARQKFVHFARTAPQSPRYISQHPVLRPMHCDLLRFRTCNYCTLCSDRIVGESWSTPQPPRDQGCLATHSRQYW